MEKFNTLHLTTKSNNFKTKNSNLKTNNINF